MSSGCRKFEQKRHVAMLKQGTHNKKTKKGNPTNPFQYGHSNTSGAGGSEGNPASTRGCWFHGRKDEISFSCYRSWDENVFQRFFQQKSSREKSVQGFPLGAFLPIISQRKILTKQEVITGSGSGTQIEASWKPQKTSAKGALSKTLC